MDCNFEFLGRFGGESGVAIMQPMRWFGNVSALNLENPALADGGADRVRSGGCGAGACALEFLAVLVECVHVGGEVLVPLQLGE